MDYILAVSILLYIHARHTSMECMSAYWGSPKVNFLLFVCELIGPGYTSINSVKNVFNPIINSSAFCVLHNFNRKYTCKLLRETIDQSAYQYKAREKHLSTHKYTNICGQLDILLPLFFSWSRNKICR